MADSIWNFTANASNAVKGMQSLLTGITPLQKVSSQLQKSGGVAGAVAGNSTQLSSTSKILDQLNQKMAQQQKLLLDTQAVLKNETDLDHYRALNAEAEKYSENIAGIKNEMEQIQPGTPAGGSGMDDAFKPSIFRPTQTVSNVANEFGGGAGGGIGQAINYAGDFGTAVSGLSRDLKEVGPVLADNITKWKGMASTLTGVANGTTEASVGFEAITAAISPMVLVAGAVVIGLVALTAVINAISGAADAAKQAEQDYLNGLLKENSLKSQLAQDAAKGDVAGIQQQIDSAKADYDTAMSNYNVAMGKLADAQAQQAKIAAEPALQQVANDPFNQAQAKLQSQIDSIKGTIDDPTSGLVSILDDARKRYEDAQAAMPAATKPAADLAAQQNLIDAEAQLVQVRTQAKDAADQETKSIQQFQQQAIDDAAKTTVERQRQDDQAATQHQRDQAKIVQDGQDQIAGIVRDSQRTLASDYTQYMRSETQAAKTLQKSLTDNDTSYQKAVAKQDATFKQDQVKAETQWERDELRRKEDLQANLTDLEFQNDAVAYITAQRNAVKTEAQAQEDHTNALSDAQAQEAQQLDDLKQSRDDQRQALLDSYADEEESRKEALAQQISDEHDAEKQRESDEKDALAKQQKDSDDAYQLQLKDQQKQRQQQDDDTKANNAKQLQQMQQTYDDQQNLLEKQDADLTRVIQSGGRDQLAAVTYGQLQLVAAYEAGADQAAAAVRSKLGSINYGNTDYSGGSSLGGLDLGSLGSGSNGGLSGLGGLSGFNLGSLSGYGGGGGLFAADGGIFDKPTLTMLGENGTEAVIPFSKSKGLPDGMGGTTNHFDFSGIQVGAGVSEAVLRDQLTALGQTLAQAFADGRAGKPY